MKVITYYTDSHKGLFKTFKESLESVSKNYEIIAGKGVQECSEGSYYEKGWCETVRRKVVFISKTLSKMKKGEKFLFSDVDVVFFRNPCQDFLNGFDLAIQNDYSSLCSGYFYGRNTEKIREFIKGVIEETFPTGDDQKAMNKILSMSPVNFKVLPVDFFTYGYFRKKT
jgi:hypothetical protein